MHFRFNRYSLLSLLLLFSAARLAAQCLPETEAVFFSKLNMTNQLPEQLVSGRSVVFYQQSLSSKELKQVQQAFADTGIDAVCAIELEKLLAGYDVKQGIYTVLQKREISNVIFVRKSLKGYALVVSKFNGQPSFVTDNQAAWLGNGTSLAELLLRLKREAQASFTSQNLLINEYPETDLTFRVFLGSRIESFTSDFRVDRMAVRLSALAEENDQLKEICSQYPFKLEFVDYSLTDVELRQKGFWYVLNCVHAREPQAWQLLGYAEGKVGQDPDEVYKFYCKKLEFDNVYLGKQWDAASTWQLSLQNFIGNIRKELIPQ